MATIPLTLYVLNSEIRLMRSPAEPYALPTLPLLVAGDTLALKVYYYDLGDINAPTYNHRYPGSLTRVRLRAYGNNTTYATADSTSEISLAFPSVARTQVGAATTAERHKIILNSRGGYFRLTFPDLVPPYSTYDNLPSSAYRFHVGTTELISVDASLADIENAIRAVPSYRTIQGVIDGPYSGLQWSVVNFIQGKEFEIQTKTAPSTPFQNLSPYSLPLTQLDGSQLLADYGWNVSLVLDGNGNTFNDLFAELNAPAYLQVLLTPSGGSEAIVSQTLLASAGDIPEFLNGPPPGGNLSQGYSFAYSATAFPTFAVTAGALPPGLTLSADGVISGTPTTPGTFGGIVTATNTGGSVTQNFNIVISGGGGGGGGGGVNTGALLTYRDGNFDIIESSDGNYYETQNDQWPGLTVWHQPIVVDVRKIVALPVGAPSFFGYFWKDTPWRYLGDNLVQFERLWHNIPGAQTRPVGVTKNYQAGLYTFTNGQLTSIAICAFSRAIKATCTYHYSLDDPGGLPILPFIQIIPFLNGQQITDLGTGFPHANFLGYNLPNNNFAASFITGSIEHVMGRLFCRKIITG